MKTMAEVIRPIASNHEVIDKETHQHEAERDGNSVDATLCEEAPVFEQGSKQAVHLATKPSNDDHGCAECQTDLNVGCICREVPGRETKQPDEA